MRRNLLGTAAGCMVLRDTSLYSRAGLRRVVFIGWTGSSGVKNDAS
jgi:hypothetical protein